MSAGSTPIRRPGNPCGCEQAIDRQFNEKFTASNTNISLAKIRTVFYICSQTLRGKHEVSEPVETAAPAGLRANLFGPSIVVVTMVGSTTVFAHWPSRRLRAPLARGRNSQGGRRGVVSRLGLRPREPIASGSGPLRMLVVGRGTPSWSCIFLIWSAGKPLKRPESDEGIQENPKPFSWSGLAWIWFGLEEFGLRRSARRRRLLAPNAPSGWAKPVALDGNQTTVEGDQTGSTRSFKNPPAANPIEVSFRWGGGGRAAAFGEVK